MVYKCIVCEKEFNSYSKKKANKYCSHKCYYRGRYGDPRKINKVCICGKSFVTFPNKIKKGLGKYCSRRCYEKNFHKRSGFHIHFSKPHPNWYKEKEGELSYIGIHEWVYRHYSKSEACDECGESKKLDWANISGEYSKDRNDWMCLCRRCHIFYDRNRGKQVKYNVEGRKYKLNNHTL